MSKETLVQLLQKSLSNFDKTEDREHLEDMVAIICEYDYHRKEKHREEASVHL